MSMDNTKSILNGLVAIAAVVEAELKDGFQAGDVADAVSKISGNGDVKAAVEVAFHNGSGLGAEWSHLDVMSLVGLALEIVPKIQALIPKK